jgi:hypothetical protein
MANSYVEYTAAGGTAGPYNVPFLYLKKAHVVVTKDGAVVTDYTWTSASQITFNANVTAGVKIKFARNTPETPLFNSADGNVLTDTQLKVLGRQAIYLAEETNDASNDTLAAAEEALAAAEAANDAAEAAVAATAADVAAVEATRVAALADIAADLASALSDIADADDAAIAAAAAAAASQTAAAASATAAAASAVAAANSAASLDAGANITWSGNNTHSGAEVFNGAVEVLDGSFVVKDTAAPTKRARLEVGGVTAGQTRVLSVPDVDITLAGRDNAETLSNKTLASPVIGTKLTWPDGNDQTAIGMSLGAQNASPPIINGCMRVAQRSAPNLSTTAAYGAVDRFAAWASVGSVSAGTISQISNSGIGRTGKALRLAGITLTGSGQLSVRYRMEAMDAARYKNLSASFAVLCSHDVGSSITYEMHIRKPASTADDFSSVTSISNTTLSVPTGINSATQLKFENVSLGDVSKGLEIEVKVPCGAITTKNFDFAEFQMNVGAKIQEFNHAEDYSAALIRCSRYYEVGTVAVSSSYVPYAGWAMYGAGSFKAHKRASPTCTVSACWVWTSNVYGMGAYYPVNSAPEGYFITFTASAEL